MNFVPKLTPVRLMLAFLVIALLIFLGYVVYYDYAHRQELLPGIRIAGVPVGGLNAAQAEAKLASELAPLREPVILKYEGYFWKLPTRGVMQIPVERMVARARQAGERKSLWERTYRRWFQQPLRVEIPLSFSLDKKKVSAFVSEVSKEIDRDPIDAAIDVSSGTVKLIPSQIGKKLERKEAVNAIIKLLPTRLHFYRLSATQVLPKVTIEDFNNIILIKQSSHTLSLFRREELVKVYPVAVGMPQYPTPVGSFKIARKRINPTWYNPHSNWSADMPDLIPPGPDNPLGSRAMDLNTPGIRIHGTPNESSIGFSVSHGCIRMKMKDAEELFSQVEVGTPVEIID